MNISALHVAALLGKTTVVNALLRCDATFDVVDQFGLTPLHMACHGGSQSCTVRFHYQSFEEITIL